MQTALRHQRKQTDGLECDRLAAGIRSGDDERPVISADRDIDRYGFFDIQQRMSGLFEVQHPVRVHLRLLRLHLTREFPLGKHHIHGDEQLLIIYQFMEMLRHIGGKLCQNTVDLRALRQLQLPQLVVQINDHLRLYEQRRAARRLIVNDARHPGAVFGF